MFVFSGRTVRAVLFSIALGTFVVSANAQQGTFTLPFETHWGNAVLPAGDYKMSSSVTPAFPKVLSISGQGISVWVIAGMANPADDSETNSYLTIQSVGSLHVVRQFVSGLTGKTYKFEMPKTIRTELAAAGSPQQEITNVAVLARH